MKAKELLEILKAEIESDPTVGDCEVVIATEGTSDQYLHDLEPVSNVGAGMDMTQNKYIIYSKNILIPKTLKK